MTLYDPETLTETDDRIMLDGLIDTYGLGEVLRSLAASCFERSDRLEEDGTIGTNPDWSSAGEKLARLADKIGV